MIDDPEVENEEDDKDEVADRESEHEHKETKTKKKQRDSSSSSKSNEKKSNEKKSNEKKSNENKSNENKSNENKSSENKSNENQDGESTSGDKSEYQLQRERNIAENQALLANIMGSAMEDLRKERAPVKKNKGVKTTQVTGKQRTSSRLAGLDAKWVLAFLRFLLSSDFHLPELTPPREK